jgi:hypothetical protein
MPLRARSIHFRVTLELEQYLERIEDEYALASKNAALAWVVNEYRKTHPTKGRTYKEREMQK